LCHIDATVETVSHRGLASSLEGSGS
jgi:hypothetical protein